MIRWKYLKHYSVQMQAGMKQKSSPIYKQYTFSIDSALDFDQRQYVKEVDEMFYKSADFECDQENYQSNPLWNKQPLRT